MSIGCFFCPGQPWCHATQGMVVNDVPTGFAPSQKWPSAPRQSQVFRRTRAVQPCSTRVPTPATSLHVRRLPSSRRCWSDGRVPGLAVDALKAELKRTRDAAKRPPVNVEVEECRKFIQRSEKRIQELDAERAAEAVALKEAKDRFQRLEVEQAQQPDPTAHPASSEISSEAQRLLALVAGIGCPVAVPTCEGCRSNTNDSGHAQFQARLIARRFRAFLRRRDAAMGVGPSTRPPVSDHGRQAR